MNAAKKQRSKKYQAVAGLIELGKIYPLPEAIALVKKVSITSFDASVEIHIRLGTDPKKSEQGVRGTIVLPYATGKTKRVAVFTEKKQDEARQAGADLVGGKELVDAIKVSKKMDFDIAVADPSMMPALAQIAKLLGPRGLMPSPKNETVTTNITKAVTELKKGKITFKNDDTSNIHQAVGKVSLPDNELQENIKTFVAAVLRAKPASAKGSYIKGITLCPTMGPAVKTSV